MNPYFLYGGIMTVFRIAAAALTIGYVVISGEVYVLNHYPLEWSMFVSIAVIPVFVALTLFILAEISKLLKKIAMLDMED
jgi:hypothetical protein